MKNAGSYYVVMIDGKFKPVRNAIPVGGGRVQVGDSFYWGTDRTYATYDKARSYIRRLERVSPERMWAITDAACPGVFSKEVIIGLYA